MSTHRLAYLGRSSRLAILCCIASTSLVLSACGEKYSRDCSSLEGQEIAWANVEPVFEEHCVRCHSSERTGTERHAAPRGIDFDSYEDAKKNAVAADKTILAGTMPDDDQGAVVDEDGCKIEAWIAQDLQP
jgi:uncharacterized membrane protein